MTQVEVAVAAAIISAVSLTVSLMNYLRDRPNARIIVFKTAIVPGRDEDEPPITLITITNTGRRPLTVHSVAYTELWNPSRVAIFPLHNKLAKKLEEGESTSDMFKKSDVLPNGSWKNVVYVFATDTAGKQYRANIAPVYKVIMFRLLSMVVNPFRRMKQEFLHKDDE